MTNKQLKNWLESGCQDFGTPLIFKYVDNPFLCHQYVTLLADTLHLDKVFINSLNDISRDDTFGTTDPCLYVYETEKLTEHIMPADTQVVVICKQLPEDLSVDYIEIAKQQAWQIEDYAKSLVPGLPSDIVHWLCEAAKYDVYRVYNECKKLSCFSDPEQPIVFDQLDSEQGYCDLNPATIFNYINALMQKDLVAVGGILRDLKYIDVEGTGVITLLKRQFRSLISMKANPKATAEALGMKPGQFYALLKAKNLYTDEQLLNIYSFLSHFDARLKNGEFSFASENRANNNKMVEYITLNILLLAGVKA